MNFNRFIHRSDIDGVFLTYLKMIEEN